MKVVIFADKVTMDVIAVWGVRLINPRTYKQTHILTIVQGGGGFWMEPLPGVFTLLRRSEIICTEEKARTLSYKMT